MMTYDEAMGKVLNAFYELADEKQIDVIVEHRNDLGDDVEIFPIEDFDKFCKEHWGDNYRKFAEVMQNTCDYAFDFTNLWCLYNKKEEAFESADTPADFAMNADTLFNMLMDDKDFIENELGFDWEDIDGLESALEEEE